jgi:hypothetical protein
VAGARTLSAGTLTLTALALAAMGGAGALPAPALGASKKQPVATKTRCAPGAYPVVKLSGKKLRPRRDKRGRLRCITTRARSRPIAPASSATRQLGQVADQLDRALEVLPSARRSLDRRLGKRRASALVALGLNGWRKSAGVARTGAHASDTTSTTFGSEADGTAGKVSYGLEEIGGDKLGIKAHGEAEMSVSRDGIEKLVGKDQLPADVKGAKVKIAVSFEDAPAACPSAAGIVSGRLHGSASITITITSASGPPTEMKLSADADMSYKATVGEDAHWASIDDVDMKTEFQGSGTGQKTETYRGHRLGGGFGREGIINGGDFSKSLTRDWALIDPQKGGGVFGPKGGWNWKRGVTLNDVKSIDNVKAMAGTWIATDALLLAGVEYLREVALKRGEKHWYDDEACLRMDGKPAAAKLRAGQQTKVTTSNAKAADGTPARTNLTASGVATLLPATASMAPGGTFDFTLTAPNATPTRSTWKVVALSRAGKKTVEGSLGDQAAYEVRLDDHELGNFATHSSTGRLLSTLRLEPVAQSDPAKWTANAPLTWSELAATSKIPECTPIDPISGGAWTVVATQSAPDAITIKLDFSADTRVLWTFHCVFPPPDGTTVDSPGLQGPSVLAMTPLTFTLPAAGGTQALAGTILDGGDGFTTSGTLTLTPVA